MGRRLYETQGMMISLNVYFKLLKTDVEALDKNYRKLLQKYKTLVPLVKQRFHYAVFSHDMTRINNKDLRFRIIVLSISSNINFTWRFLTYSMSKKS